MSEKAVAASQAELMENTLSFERQVSGQANMSKSVIYYQMLHPEAFLHMHTKRMNNVKVAGLSMLFLPLRHLKLSEAHF